MKTLSVPFPSFKVIADKTNVFLSAVKSEIFFFFSKKSGDRPSKMHRLIFSTQKSRKSVLTKEQYVMQEPDYYGNYE
jgi:hypothetical protein